jgi:hypothetical protein
MNAERTREIKILLSIYKKHGPRKLARSIGLGSNAWSTMVAFANSLQIELKELEGAR